MRVLSRTSDDADVSCAGIFLSTMKLSHEEICHVIKKLDEKYLSYEVATRLLDNAPKPDEVRHSRAQSCE